jgi:hypothetical protein
MPPLKLPSRRTMDEYPPLRRVHFRLWQIGLAAMTVGVTGWCYTFGPFAAITATCVAKHVLVAILAAGLDLPDETKDA